MVKAGALYYSVFVSFIIALISGFLILSTFYYNQYIDNQVIRSRMTRDIQSALSLVLTSPDMIAIDELKTISLFEEEGAGKVIISRRKWGMYDVVVLQTGWNTFSKEKIALLGENIFKGKEPVALYIPDKGKYLSLSGNSFLRGTCYVPKLGLRRGAIEGQSFSGDELNHGAVKNSSTSLPLINNEIIDNNKDYLTGDFFGQDSLLDIEKAYYQDSIVNSFANKTVIYYSPESIQLRYASFKGNIKIISARSIEVLPSAKLENIILYAPQISILSGFKGCLQAFADEGMAIGQNCSLLYPSAVGVISKITGEINFEIQENTDVYGGVLLYFYGSSKNTPVIKINENAKIRGQVYCTGNVQLRGVIYGSLYCDGFILKTVSSTYENHLLNARIDFEGLSTYYTGINFTGDSGRKDLILWLN